MSIRCSWLKVLFSATIFILHSYPFSSCLSISPISPVMISTNSSHPSKLHTDLFLWITKVRGFPDGSDVKDSAHNVGDQGLMVELRRSLGEGNGHPLQYSGLENSMDCIVHGVSKSWTLLSNFHFTKPLGKLTCIWERKRDSQGIRTQIFYF